MVKEYPTEKIRNIGLIGHGGSGKTSFAEAILYSAGVTTRLGRVQEGNTVSDYHPDEIAQQVSINLSLLHCEWKDTKINIVDMPGYADFIGEVKSGLKVTDTALLFVKISPEKSKTSCKTTAMCFLSSLSSMSFISIPSIKICPFLSRVKLTYQIYNCAFP